MSDTILSTVWCKQTSLACYDQIDHLIDDSKHRAEKSLGRGRAEAPVQRTSVLQKMAVRMMERLTTLSMKLHHQLSGLQQNLLSQLTSSLYSKEITKTPEKNLSTPLLTCFRRVCCHFISFLKLKAKEKTETWNNALQKSFFSQSGTT